MVLCAGGMRLIVLGRSTRFPPATSPSPERRTPAGTMSAHVRSRPRLEKPSPPARPVRNPADQRLVPLRQLPRRAAAVGRPAGDAPAVLLHRRPARADLEQDPKKLRERTYVAAAQLIAMGIDPERSAIFVQSHMPEHAELAWVLQCLTGFGEARRMTQFKDKSAKGGEGAASRRAVHLPDPPGGRHPALPAEYVPVGEDQRQHLELTRDLAQRFNHRYKKTFRLPEPYILKSTAKILDLQNPAIKMSKSSSSAGRHHRDARRPQGLGEEDPLGRHRLRLRDPLRPRGEAGGLQPAHDLLGAHRPGHRRPRHGVRRAGVRRPQGRPGRRGGRVRHAVPRPHPGAARRPGRAAATCSRRGRAAGEVARRTLADVYERVGFVPR